MGSPQTSTGMAGVSDALMDRIIGAGEHSSRVCVRVSAPHQVANAIAHPTPERVR